MKQEIFVLSKRCSQCKKWKAGKDFSKNRATKDGLRCYCKLCVSVRGKEYRSRNREKIREYKKEYSILNFEKIRVYQKEWKKLNLKKYNEYHREYYKKWNRTDIKYKLNCRMRSAMWIVLRGNKNGRHWEDLVGYAAEELKKRLELTMPDGYSWDDFLSGKLHIDHRIPVSAFNFSLPEHIDFQRCWDLNNLQLLPARENMIKHGKLTEPFQPCLKL